MITRHLTALAVRDTALRKQALKEILESEGLPYTLQEQEPSFKVPLGITNYVIEPYDSSPSVLLCAHYDAYPGSLGANDNASSVCLLIDLAKELRQRGINARIAFFDGEENKQIGSKFYVSEIDSNSITGVINLDLCGFGDSIVMTKKGNFKKTDLEAFDDKKFLKSNLINLLKYLPPSDDVSFQRSFPTISLSIVPYWDVQYLKTLATYGGGFFGRPPEYDMIFEQMEISTTMHGGYRDTPEYVEAESMQKVYDFLLKGLIESQ